MKIFLSWFIVISFVSYSVYQKVMGTDVVLLNTSTDSQRTPRISIFFDDDNDNLPYEYRSNTAVKPSLTIGGNNNSQSRISAVSSREASGAYKDGKYTGDVADAYYGNIQVQVLIQGGKITDVVFLDYPQDRRNSVRVNTRAMPILKQEAIAAQSAQVDAVSGASATSKAFIESLGTALAKAQG